MYKGLSGIAWMYHLKNVKKIKHFQKVKKEKNCKTKEQK